MTDVIREEIFSRSQDNSIQQGLRVLGGPMWSLREDHAYTVDDEGDMILTGYLAFLNPPNHLQRQQLRLC